MYYFKIVTTLITIIFSVNLFAALEKKDNGEFVRISGEVTKVTADYFHLKTDSDKIVVEMDDYDWDADGFKLIKGDDVVVTGFVDNDFLENKKIEAGSVYVKSIDSYFFASSADEESAPYISIDYSVIDDLPENTVVDIQGKVTNINGREFTLDTGLRKVTVDTEDLIYNPMDNVGFTEVNKYDRIRVSGIVDNDYYDTKELDASYISELD